MYGALHPKTDIDRLYLKQKHGERGLIGFEMCLRSEENNLGLYVSGSNEMFLKGIKKVGIKLKIVCELYRMKINFRGYAFFDRIFLSSTTS